MQLMYTVLNAQSESCSRQDAARIPLVVFMSIASHAKLFGAKVLQNGNQQCGKGLEREWTIHSQGERHAKEDRDHTGPHRHRDDTFDDRV